jgi:hypothetical protein
MPNLRSIDLCSPNASRVASVKCKEAVMDKVSVVRSSGKWTPTSKPFCSLLRKSEGLMAFKDDKILFQHSQAWIKHTLLRVCFLSLCFML